MSWKAVAGRSLEETREEQIPVYEGEGLKYTRVVGYKRTVTVIEWVYKFYNPSYSFTSLVGTGGVVDHYFRHNPITRAVEERKMVQTAGAWTTTYAYNLFPPPEPE